MDFERIAKETSLIQLLTQVFQIVQTKFDMKNIIYRTLALEGTWILANLFSGPNWVAEQAMIQDGKPSIFFLLVEDFLKVQNAQLTEISLLMIGNCLESGIESSVFTLYIEQSHVLNCIYELFNKQQVHKSHLEWSGWVLSQIAKIKSPNEEQLD